MSEKQILYLSRADVEAVDLPMPAIIDLLEQAFKEKGHGKVEMPPKPGIHTMPDAFIHAMPAYIPAHALGGHQVGQRLPGELQARPAVHQRPADPQRRRDRHPLCRHGLHLDHRLPHRRGPALAAKYLARPESETVGILACGVQGRTNLEALACLFPIKKVYAYDILPEVQERYVRE